MEVKRKSKIYKLASTLLVIFAIIVATGGWLYYSNISHEIGGRYKIINGQVHYLPHPEYAWRPVKNADPRTFEYVGGEDLGEYAKDDKRVYIQHEDIDGADPDSFQVLGGGYSKDKNNVYSSVYIIANADPHSFTYLGGDHAKDKNHVYFGGSIIHGADPARTFSIEMIGKDGRYYGKSQEFVDYRGNIISGADPATLECFFEEYCDHYAKDKSHVYFDGVAIPDVDIATVQFKYRYLKDKSHVFYRDEIVPDADPLTFEEIAFSTRGSYPNYAIDKNYVYFHYKRILGADPESFEILVGDPAYKNDETGVYSKDKNNVYYEEKLVESADPATFQYVCSSFGKDYAKDKNQVYSKTEIIKDADPSQYLLDKCITLEEWEQMPSA